MPMKLSGKAVVSGLPLHKIKLLVCSLHAVAQLSYTVMQL
jgi:hypothetical protein